MRYVDEFRDKKLAKALSQEIWRNTTQQWRIMEVCGGQTHTILQYGLEDLLPDTIQLLHGPGCPVCVTPLETINKAITIAQISDVILCSYGDMLRVPGTDGDLLQTKALGADVRIVYSPLDALTIAQKNPDRRIVFFAVGFETTAPANAMAAHQAKKLGIKNFFLLCSHVAVPPVVAAILNSPDNRVQAFLGPGHVCSVMGTSEYEELSHRHGVPIVITGFEPIDLLEGILRCVKQLEQKQAVVENQYARAVSNHGNENAKKIMTEVFEISNRTWRGLGPIPLSGFRLNDAYRHHDAEAEFDVATVTAAESSQCISGEILRGLKKPADCAAFGRQCTPENPLGATMVSSEGTCATYYKFGKHRGE